MFFVVVEQHIGYKDRQSESNTTCECINEHIIQSFAYQRTVPLINIFLRCYNCTPFLNTLVKFYNIL
jgi:hypothetical protein